MYKRRIIVLLLVAAMGFMACGNAFAATGEGYFGDEDLEDAAVPELEADTVPEPAPSKPVINSSEYRPPVFPYDDTEEERISDEEPSGYDKKPAVKLEKYSEDTVKVLRSYGLDAETFDRLLDRHNDAAKGIGNQEKFDRYEIIFNEYPFDYLAAYRAAQANMAMDRKGQAHGWLERALKIHPNYIPARQLLKRARAR